MGIFRSDEELSRDFRSRCSHSYRRVEMADLDDPIMADFVRGLHGYHGPRICICQRCGTVDAKSVKEVYSRIQDLDGEQDTFSEQVIDLKNREYSLRMGAPLPENELGRRIKNQRERIGALEAEVRSLRTQLENSERASQDRVAAAVAASSLEKFHERHQLVDQVEFERGKRRGDHEQYVRELGDLEQENFRLRDLLRTNGIDPSKVTRVPGE